MSDNYFENEILKQLQPYIEAGSIKVIADSTPLFTDLAQAYPVIGSKIDWNKVPNSIQQSFGNSENEVEIFKQFFTEIVLNQNLRGKLVYAGDGAVEFALEGSVEIIKQLLPALLSLPQHHYFFGEDYTWCLCFSFEGDAAFGYRSIKKMKP